MFALTINQLLFTMAAVGFTAGFVTFWIGVVVMVRRSANRELQAIAAETSQMAQKGLTDGLAGLVGNAAALISAMNELIKTQNGIGSFLIVVGVILMITSTALAIYLFVSG